jgi:hypothetical protein
MTGVTMPEPETQRKSRADAKLDAGVLDGLGFFRGQYRTKKHKAAILLAEDELTVTEVAKTLGISRSFLYEWKAEPEFQQIIGHYAGEIVADALKLPIAKKMWRVQVLNDGVLGDLEAKRLRGEYYASLLADNAETAMMREFGHAVPEWAATGKFVSQPKIAANGKTVTEWAYDRALESAIESKLKQAAQELGQWVEQSKQDINVSDGITREYILVDDDE